MLSAATLDPFLDQLRWIMWTQVLPGFVLAMVAGLILRSLVERVAIALARRWLALTTRKPRPTAAAPGNMVARLAVAVPVELAAPPCPTCQRPMVHRTARRGASAGQSFWGCSGYPACRGTRPDG